MSENREYVSRSDELGNIHISGEVLASIAAAAALEVGGSQRAECQPGQRHRRMLLEQQEEPGPRESHIQVEDEAGHGWNWAVLMSYGHTIPRWDGPCRTR